jgi:hypothetical protein
MFALLFPLNPQYFPAFRADDVISRMLGGKTFPNAKNHERYRAMPLWQASATGELMDTYVCPNSVLVLVSLLEPALHPGHSM